MNRRKPPDATPTPVPAERAMRPPGDAKAEAVPPASAPAPGTAKVPARPAGKPPVQHGPARRKRW